MISLAVQSSLLTSSLTRDELQVFANSLGPQDTVVVLFREPLSASPTLVKWWRGVVVPNDDGTAVTETKWIAFDEAPIGTVVPFPPPVESAERVEFLVLRRVPAVLPPEDHVVVQQASPLRGRAGSALAFHIDPTMLPRQGSQGNLDSPDPSFRLSNGSSMLLTAMTGRLYPKRTLVMFVCMAELQDSQPLLDSNLSVHYFKSPMEALAFIDLHFDELAAVVTSSCKNEFEREGISGVDLCNAVIKRRGPGGVSPPFAMMVTKSFTMHEVVQSCDIFVHPPTQSEGTNIAMKELLRRLVPPSVVWVVQNLSFVTESMKERIATLGFSLRLFDSTLVAYEFISTCPWNIAAVVTSPLTDLVHKRDLSGIELAARLRHRQVCRFIAPLLILLFRPSDVLSCQCSEEFNEQVEDTGEDDVIERLLEILEKVKSTVDNAEFPGAVVFGRACYISLSNTFSAHFSTEIAGEVFDFPNVEQFFQAVKHFGTREEFDAIRTNPSVHGALQRSWSLKIRSREWNSLRDDIMRFALYQKFKIPEFRDALLATGTKEIIQTTPEHDLYWGDGNQDGGRGHGRNRLGEMLMETRQNLRRNAHFDFPFPYARLAAVLHRCEKVGDTRTYRSNNVFVIDYDCVLGKGGFGKVYKATDTFTAQAVAVKLLQVRPGISPADLRREFDLLARIDDPNVVKVLNAEFDDEQAKIFMEFMSGGSVDALVKKHRFYEPAIRHHIQQVLHGLDALHRKYNIVHCDIKPQNFLLDGHVSKLSDFGSSTVATNESETAGTVLYMSPSRLQDNRGSKADDIWAIGCSVVRMALGGNLQPWMREDEAADARLGLAQLVFRAQQPPYYPAIPTILSPKAQAFVLRCFTQNPEYRPSAAELLNDPWFFDPVDGVEQLDKYLRAFNLTGSAEHEHFSRNFVYTEGTVTTNYPTASKVLQLSIHGSK